MRVGVPALDGRSPATIRAEFGDHAGAVRRMVQLQAPRRMRPAKCVAEGRQPFGSPPGSANGASRGLGLSVR